VALAFLGRYRQAFGLRDPRVELAVEDVTVDALGMAHVTLQQRYQGVAVYGSEIKVHLGATGKEVVAVSNSFVPGIRLPDVRPRLSAKQARTIAQEALPDAWVRTAPHLIIYPGTGSRVSEEGAKLAWSVELLNDAIPARNVYVVDAINGTILDVLDRLYTVGSDAHATNSLQPYHWRLTSPRARRYREVYNAYHTTSLPGTLVRSEGQGPTGDVDVDHAYDFTGATYDYYYSTHGRDSYDDQGASLIATVHYGRNYNNAFWNGEQMVYGDEFPVKDVTAHELTHAVTEHTANLEYQWQSGALNESISDIFGAMVDRDDWLMGEDLPPDVLGGQEAIRDLANPSRFGQPDHVNDWVSTCSDHEGVHINSGIPNKAYYNIATAIGKDKAERIFYRTLVIYLQPSASLEDARAAAIQSATDLYSDAEVNAVRNGFNAVGLDGVWQPPPNDCTCAAKTTLSYGRASQPSRLQTLVTLYRVRDQLLETTPAGQHYRTLYYQHTGRIAKLLLYDPGLRAMGDQVLQAVTPGLRQLVDGQGDETVITAEMVRDLSAFLKRLAEADSGGELTQAIEQEMERLSLDKLSGMTFAEAWQFINMQ